MKPVIKLSGYEINKEESILSGKLAVSEAGAQCFHVLSTSSMSEMSCSVWKEQQHTG